MKFQFEDFFVTKIYIQFRLGDFLLTENGWRVLHYHGQIIVKSPSTHNRIMVKSSLNQGQIDIKWSNRHEFLYQVPVRGLFLRRK